MGWLDETNVQVFVDKIPKVFLIQNLRVSRSEAGEVLCHLLAQSSGHRVSVSSV